MGNTTSATQPPAAAGKGQGDPKAKGKDDDPWGETEEEKKAKEKKKQTNLFYDEKDDQYYNPITGEVVDPPGKYDPEPPKRPLRVKVRKRQHYTLRKRRKPPKPVPVPQSPDPPTPPKPLRPPTQYDADGFAMYYDEFGNRIEYDEYGHLIPPEPYYDDYGDYVEPMYDEYGNLVVYDSYGIPVDNDENGDPVEYDRYGYPIEFDEEGNPIERTYYPKYDEYGNEIPPKKKKEPKFDYPDDGYDYDDSIYTYTTLDSPIPPTPSPVSSDDVQEKDDSGDDLSMEDVTEFTWKPHQVVMPKDEARALIKTGGETCSCFPQRSNPLIPSMVYDQVTCPHTNYVIGHAHEAVARFDDNWNDRFTRVHRPKRHDRLRSKVTGVWGYPNRQFPDYKSTDEMFEGGLRGEFQKPTSRPPEGGSADRKKESATGSQKPDSKSKVRTATETKKDEKKDKESKKEKKAKEKEDAKKKGKETASKTDKDAKAKDDAKEDKKKDNSKTEDKKTAAGKDKDKDKSDDKQSKTGSKKEDKKDKAQKGKDEDKENENEKKDEGKKEDPSAKADDKIDETKNKDETKPGSKQDAKKSSQSTKNADVKPDKANQLSREKMNPPQVPKPKEPQPMAAKNKGRAANQSRTSIVAKNFLPKIGYTPDHPFSNAKTRSPSPGLESRKEYENFSLPPIPASPAYSLVSSMTASSQDFHHQPEIRTSRKFEGKYYDPVTKKTYTYEIKPRFGKHVQDWDALRQV